jgi:hypothetical protein
MNREMPVGIEPTSTALQAAAWPSGSSIFLNAECGIENNRTKRIHCLLFRVLRSAFERAGGGGRTRIIRITGAAPFCVEPHRHLFLPARAQGFEPCPAVLEAACTPRRTLV